MATWRDMLTSAMERNNETLGDIVYARFYLQNYEDNTEVFDSPKEIDRILDINFNSGYGLPEGHSFVAWTNDNVYFSVQYDGSEWADSVPRNPSEITPVHYGG